MDTTNPRPASFKPTFELHEAAGVSGDHGIDPQGLEFIDLVIGHAGGDAGQVDAEGATETTTTIAGGGFDQFEASNRGEKSSWFIMNAEFPESMTGIVPCDLSKPGRTKVLTTKPSNQERRKLHGGASHPGRRFGILFTALLVKQFDGMAEHGDTGTRWSDDGFTPLVQLVREPMDRPPADR